jgi:hypothetical protein
MNAGRAVPDERRDLFGIHTLSPQVLLTHNRISGLKRQCVGG